MINHSAKARQTTWYDFPLSLSGSFTSAHCIYPTYSYLPTVRGRRIAGPGLLQYLTLQPRAKPGGVGVRAAFGGHCCGALQRRCFVGGSKGRDLFIYLVVNTFLLTSVGRGRGGRGGGMDGVTYVPWKVWGGGGAERGVRD